MGEVRKVDSQSVSYFHNNEPHREHGGRMNKNERRERERERERERMGATGKYHEPVWKNKLKSNNKSDNKLAD